MITKQPLSQQAAHARAAPGTCWTYSGNRHSCSVPDQQAAHAWQPLDCTYCLLNAQTTAELRAASCTTPCMKCSSAAKLQMQCTLVVVQVQVRQMVKSERELSSELRTAQDHIDAEMQQLKHSAQVSGSKR